MASSGRNWVKLDSWAWLGCYCVGLQMCVLKLHLDSKGTCADMTRQFCCSGSGLSSLGIRVGLNTRVPSETRCGWGRRSVWRNWTCQKTAEHKGDYCIRERHRKQRHVRPSTRSWTAPGCRRNQWKSASCLKWDLAGPSTHPSIPLCSSATVALLLPEAFRLLDGEHKLLF